MFFRFFAVLLISSSLGAQSIYEFLKLDYSPKAAALAGSFVANNDDPNVIFYNPAGLYNINETMVSFSYLKHLLDVNSASLSLSYNLERIGKIGFGVQYINYGSFDEADEFGNITGEFGANEFAFVLGYANLLDENFNYGVNAKFIYSGIADVSSMGAAFDIGLNYIFPETNWSVGFSVLNIGTQISKYYEIEEDMPLDIRIGFVKKLQHIPFKLFFSLNRLNESTDNIIDKLNQFTFGGEFRISSAINLRFGYDNQKRKDMKLSGSTGLAGFNFGFGIFVRNYNFDYSFSSLGSVGALHRLGLSTSF